jgi:hypothetical protein
MARKPKIKSLKCKTLLPLNEKISTSRSKAKKIDISDEFIYNYTYKYDNDPNTYDCNGKIVNDDNDDNL